MSHIYDNIFQGDIEGTTLIMNNEVVHYITVIRVKHWEKTTSQKICKLCNYFIECTGLKKVHEEKVFSRRNTGERREK